MPKVSRLGVRIDPDLKKKAEALAKEDRRSLSSWIEALIAREIAKTEAAKKVKK